MKLRSIAAACAAVSTLTLAGAAFAADAVTAKLATPIAQKVKVVAGGAVFNCEADACIAAATSSQTFSEEACKTVANKVGPLASFEGRKAFDESRLASCNARAVAKAGAGAVLAKQ
jgi:hypothetical protein